MEEYLLFIGLGLFFLIAMLYSSIGHAGASGYLAVMSLLSFAPAAIKPTSLVLNIVVALIASVQFIGAGRFDRKIFLVFVATSLPMAFVGGYISLPPEYFKLFAGIFLILSAVMLLVREWMKPPGETVVRKIPLAAGLLLGAVIGLLSGLVGVGGGIFLSPIIIMAGWSTVKNASGIAALFIFCNSIAGLAGHVSALQSLDPQIGYWLAAVVAGGALGSYLGTKKFNTRVIVVCLFIVLLTAGIKFVAVDFLK